MSAQLINSFTSYEFTENDAHNCVFTNLQLQYLQTQLAQAAESRLNLNLDPKNLVAFAQHEAYLKGQLDTYRFLITNSIETEKLLSNSNNFSD